jgi:KDO2-lipid IV(A) lauroyltransferase
MWSAAQLPFTLQMALGRQLGILSYHFARERRHICEVNLRLCFPELNEVQHRKLVRDTFIANGIGFIEIAISWYRDVEDFRHRVTVTGFEHVERAMAKGKGVLLVGAHFSTLEFGGFLFNLLGTMDVTYRPNNNRLFQAAMLKGRQRYYPHVLERSDVRGAMRSLKEGRILWYAPDQDYGARHSVFVPFFGVPAATITATSRFARFNDSAVVMYSHYRNADNSGYHLYFSEPLADYPSDDDEADARRINALIETAVRQRPEQYLWLHKRFKTQAEGIAARPY